MIKYIMFFLPLLLFYPLLGLPPVLFYYIVYFYNCKKPKVITASGAVNRDFFGKRFYPFILGYGFLFQTFLDKFRVHREEKNIIYLTNSDGGKFSVVVADNNTDNNIILIHGFGSSCNAPYVINFERLLIKNNYRVFSMNMRGVNCELLTPQFFHIGFTTDLKLLVEYICKNYEGKISLLGFSLGGSWIIKFLGEYSELDFMKRIKCGVAISSPLDFNHISQLERNVLHKITINKIVAYKLKKYILKYPMIYKYCNLRENDVMELKYTQDIDEKITTKIFGYASKEEYYKENSAVKNMHLINRPLLIVLSEDDVVSPISNSAIKICQDSEDIILVLTKRGGHLGYYGNDLSQSYIENMVLNFLTVIRN